MKSKDILIVWVGQAGINIAERFWDYCYETLLLPLPQKYHQNGKIAAPQMHEKLKTTEFYTEFEIEEARRMFFYNLLDDEDRETEGPKKYIPRTIFMDVDSEPIKSFMTRNKDIFPKEAFIYNELGSYSTFARALRLGEGLKPYLLERIQTLMQTRAIKNLEGIILVHATGGGAGSGLLQNIFEVLNDQYANTPILTFSIFPSQKLSGNVVEVYNTLYTTNILLDNAQGTILLDNDKIIDLVQRSYEIPSPSYEDINLVISRLIFSVLMQFAMPGAILRMDFNKLFTNLVPYNNMKFIVPGIAPFNFNAFSMNKEEEIVIDLTDPSKFLVQGDFESGKYVSGMYLFMGQLGPEIKTPLRKARSRMNFCPWITGGISVALTPRDRMTLDGQPILRQGITLVNNTSLRFLFQQLLFDFNTLFQRKAFLSHFLRENSQSHEILKQAAKNLLRMVKFYKNVEESGT